MEFKNINTTENYKVVLFYVDEEVDKPKFIKGTQATQVAFLIYNENRTYNSLLDEIIFVSGEPYNSVDKKFLQKIVTQPFHYLNKNGVKLNCEGEKEPADGSILARLINYGIYIRE